MKRTPVLQGDPINDPCPFLCHLEFFYFLGCPDSTSCSIYVHQRQHLSLVMLGHIRTNSGFADRQNPHREPAPEWLTNPQRPTAPTHSSNSAHQSNQAAFRRPVLFP